MDALPKQTVLIVDDEPTNIMVLQKVLQDDYHVRAATNGERAIEIAQSETPPDIILLDVMMPGIDGFEVCRRLKGQRSSEHIPIIFVTAMGEIADEARGFELGAVDYIHKPISAPIVKARVRTHLAMYDQNRELEKRVNERTAELQQTRLQIIRRLGRAGEFRDNETGMHVIRVSHYCRLIAEEAGLSEEAVETLYNASPMHDIGKIGVHDNILLKPDRLTEEEYETMRMHALIGSEILGEQTTGLLATARTVALTHHEKWNGTGYPNGLKGEEIPLVGRITAIADVFDALTSERPYKPAWPIADAVALIKREAGEHFDPALVQIFEKVLPQILVCREKYADKPRCAPVHPEK